MRQKIWLIVSALGVFAAVPGSCAAKNTERGYQFDADPPPVPPHLRLPPRQPGEPPRPLHNQGLVRVAYSDASTGVYLGSPAITRLDADTLLIAHDFFPEWGRTKRTAVLSSKDGGNSWQPLALLTRQFWSSLFVHRGVLYLLGTDDEAPGNAVSIARSTDGGATWNQSLLLQPPPGCHWGTGSVPVLHEGGRLWRGMEYWCGPSPRWPQDYQALLIHAPEDADLLEPAAWRATTAVQFNSTSMLPAWMPGPVTSGGFLEGNAVRLPGGGGLGLLLRCCVYDAQGRMYSLQQACLMSLPLPQDGSAGLDQPSSAAQHPAVTATAAAEGLGRRLNAELAPHGSGQRQLAALVDQQQQQQEGYFGRAAVQQAAGPQPATEAAKPAPAAAPLEAAPPLQLQWRGFVDMPGGGNRFQVQYDPASRLYLALTNPSIDRYGSNSDPRNILVLVHSANLLDWRIATTVLVPNDGLSWEQSLWYTGYHYVDWIIDGDDMLAAIRTSYDGANSFHNSNQITFKRIKQYRQYLPGGAAPAADS